MLTNMNSFDRSIRLIAGAVIGLLYFAGAIQAGPALFLAVLGVILVTTGILNFCPFYLAGNTSTRQNGRA